MNGKKRWQISVAFSIIIHIAILLFAARQITLWLPNGEQPLQQDAADVFVADQPEDQGTGPDDSRETAAPAQTDSDIAVPSENQPAEPSEQPEPQESAEKQPEAEAKHSDDDDKKNRPPRYPIISLNAIDWDRDRSAMEHPPEPVIKIDSFELPDDAAVQQEPVSVEVKFMVDADGSVRRANISKSSGSEEIDDEALRTIYKWRFKPMQKAWPIPIPWTFWPKR